MDPISEYDTTDVTEYFSDKVKRPRWRKGLAAIDQGLTAMESMPVDVPLNIGALRQLYRRLTEGSRLMLAAWRWLRPNYPSLTLADLASLQKLAGLDHLHQQTFAQRLIARCKETIREHPRLKYWAEHRIGLLDYVAHPPRPLPQELLDSALTLRLSMTKAHHLFWQDSAEALVIADDNLGTAMEAAARALTHSLGKEDSAVSSNLMVRVRKDSPPPIVSAMAQQNAQLAEQLWKTLESEHRLVIIAEARGANNVGFWVPLAQGENGVWLPGAPSAWGQQCGSVVFKDDLHNLSGFGDSLNRRWQHFMRERFKERLFVSLPFTVPNRGGRTVPGVLNVNVDAADVSGWHRACHSEWLTVARERVQPFIEIAFGAILLKLTGNSVGYLDTGSENWDSLPTGTAVPLLKKGGADDSGQGDGT